MFLRDDQVLLDNFHVLCDYGIPRSKIGKMYKEAREIFGYDFGVMSSKLQAYENLGLSKPTVIKLVSSCPLLLIGGLNCELVEVLQKLKALGIGNDWIRGYVTGDSMYNWGRMLDTMNFLEKVGYSEEKMCSLFKANPALLFEGSGKRVYILFGRLLKLGLKTNEVYCLFKQNPQILSSKYSRNLLQAVDFLLEIGMWIEDIADIVINHTEFLGSCTLKRPRSVCKDLKVEKDGLCEIIKEDPLKLLRLASKSKNKISEKVPCTDLSKHREKTSFLLRLGYIENSDEMTKALKLFRGRGDQLQERFDSLVQAGLDYNIVINIVRQAPTVLNQSKDVIEKKIDCLKNCLGYPLESVVAFPAYLCYDLGRINLRFSMYAWLRERGVAKPTLSLSTLLACSDARFVRYFVDVHPEGPVMWESLKNQLI
ncbi:transcription termination factor MTEF18, mitochondrial isoform X2 [Ziziphus jujuba]|nr:transcription termination factor MTEF18, mitochondrial isoform X2 [Ziziphus jujuba]